MKKIFLLFLIPAFAFTPPGKPVTVKGSLKTPDPAKMVYLMYRTADNTVTDSAAVTNGQFTFNEQVEEPTLAILRVKFDKPGEKTGYRFEALQVFLEPGQISIAVKDSLKSATVTGSKAHTAFEQYNKLQKPYTDAMQGLNSRYMEFRKEKNEEGMKSIEAEAESLEKKMTEVQEQYLKQNPQSPIALYVLKDYAGYSIDPQKVEPMFARLPLSAQKSPSGAAFKEAIETAKKTAVGAYAMDFSQNDTLDRPVALSSFKGKYVLVDFWASWCGPCRAENPNVVTAFNKYKDKNFTVLGVSLDRPGAKEKWLDAIHKDNLTWTHVSDLKFWDNAAAKQYGIKAIPQNLLLDPQGKIVAKNIRGEELQNKLAELIK